MVAVAADDEQIRTVLLDCISKGVHRLHFDHLHHTLHLRIPPYPLDLGNLQTYCSLATSVLFSWSCKCLCFNDLVTIHQMYISFY